MTAEKYEKLEIEDPEAEASERSRSDQIRSLCTGSASPNLGLPANYPKDGIARETVDHSSGEEKARKSEFETILQPQHSSTAEYLDTSLRRRKINR